MTDTLTAAVRAACDAVIPSEIECPWPDCSCLCDEKDGSAILAQLLTTARAKATEAERERCAVLIENHQETQSSGPDGVKFHLTRRMHGSLTGLSFAAAIRAPATQDKKGEK